MEDLARDQASRLQSREDERAVEARHECPWCSSRRTHLVQRGFTGPTDERDTYLTCDGCGRTTLKIISKTMREMRVGQFRTGGVYRDSLRQSKYTIERVLKVGMNEYLLYLKPITRRSPT
jgi:hypothetical protein